MSPQSGATGTRTNQTREAAQAPKLFLTTVLGIGPYCVEYADGEIVHTRSEDRQHLFAAAHELLEALKTTAGNIRSLGPAGALGSVPMEYERWLAVVDAAIAKAVRS